MQKIIGSWTISQNELTSCQHFPLVLINTDDNNNNNFCYLPNAFINTTLFMPLYIENIKKKCIAFHATQHIFSTIKNDQVFWFSKISPPKKHCWMLFCLSGQTPENTTVDREKESVHWPTTWTVYPLYKYVGDSAAGGKNLFVGFHHF